MEPPKSLWSLCARLFCLMGALFVLLGTIFFIARVSANSGPAWFFVPIGAALLMAGLICLILCFLQTRRIKRLKSQGVSVTGTIQSVRRLLWINWNTTSLMNWPGQHSPWVVRCSYSYQGRIYTVQSGLSWQEPFSGPQHPVVYLDPHHPARAYVDMDTIKWLL